MHTYVSFKKEESIENLTKILLENYYFLTNYSVQNVSVYVKIKFKDSLLSLEKYTTDANKIIAKICNSYISYSPYK